MVTSSESGDTLTVEKSVESGQPVAEASQSLGLGLDSLDLAYRETLLGVLVDGFDVTSHDEQSVGSGKATRELLNYSFEIPDARDRIIATPLNHLRATLAVGRFLWMMAGSDRLDDIRFYEKDGLTRESRAGVARFSDDGLSIAGSNYGARLFSARPGVDQVAACIELINRDANTRRAAMSIFQPEDAGRSSADIPCTFGVLLSPRDSILNLTVVMRSNNAWHLLPYNVFEFTLLGEIIATEVGMPVGAYHHFAVSMHLFQDNWEAAREAVGAESFHLENFPDMPRGSLTRVRELCRWESWVRHNASGLGKRKMKAELRRLESHGEFWGPFGRVVLAKGLLNAKKADLAHEVAEGTAGPLGQLLRLELDPKATHPTVANSNPAPSQELIEEIHQERLRRSQDEQVNAQFWLAMIRERLSDQRKALS